MIQRNLRAKKSLYLAGFGTILIGLLMLLFQQWYSSRETLVKEAQMLAAILGANASAALVFNDPVAAEEVLRTSTHSPMILEARLQQPDGRVLARHLASNVTATNFSAEPIGESGFLFVSGRLLVQETVLLNDQPVGQVLLALDLASIKQHLYRFLLALGLIVCTTALIFWLSSRQLRRQAHAAELALHHQAHHDRLTGLANRFAFEAALEQILKHYQRSEGLSALLFLDVDGFKKINDHFGHHVGDNVLLEIANRLKRCIRSSDLIARLGGDEFGVILTDIDHPDSALRLANKMIAVLADPFFIKGEISHLGLSVGIALIPRDGNTAEDMLTHADMAMYQAKNTGRNQAHFFSDAIADLVHHRISMEQDLRLALTQNQFFLAYQPQVIPATGALHGLEALIRWQHPQKGLIPPNTFIPIAEESELILEIGNWVMTKVCQDIQQWSRAGVQVPPVSINLSARQFACPTLKDDLLNCLQQYGLSPRDVEVELTESLAMSNAELSSRTLHEISKAGFHLAIDDFGTGYSSLAYLKRLPVNKLKIDRSFVIGLGEVPEDEAIVVAIINMAKALGLMVVAEGVETREQAEILERYGCDLFQGYLTGRPMPAQQLMALLLPQPPSHSRSVAAAN